LIKKSARHGKHGIKEQKVPSSSIARLPGVVFVRAIKRKTHLKQRFGVLDFPQFLRKKMFLPSPQTKQPLAEL